MPQGELAKNTFRTLLFRSVVLPVVLMGLLAALLIWQIGRLLVQAHWVERHDQIIARLYYLEKLHIDLETGMRGFLLTGKDEFLQPYKNGLEVAPKLFEETRQLLADRPDTLADLAAIGTAADEWKKLAEKRIADRRVRGFWSEELTTGEGKRRMDELRGLFAKLVERETELRTQKTVETSRTAVVTMAAAGFFTLFIGVVISLLSRRQMQWLAGTYQAALEQAKQNNTELEHRVDERTRELSGANGKLNEANKELEAFAYSISHDLRAPMRHITGFAGLLQQSLGPQISPDDRENLDTIHRTAILAGRMVDDLLAFSRVGRTQLRTAEIDMNALVAESIASLGPETQNRTIDWQIASLLPAHGDRALVKMVVQNLIANAVKYTGSREKAHIEVGSRNENDGVTYWVRDNGVGFDMAYSHKLFGVFQRLHRAEEFEGTGIGLANVRRIIIRHGGQVWAEGIPDAGAAFYFHLPNITRVDPKVEAAASEVS